MQETNTPQTTGQPSECATTSQLTRRLSQHTIPDCTWIISFEKYTDRLQIYSYMKIIDININISFYLYTRVLASC